MDRNTVIGLVLIGVILSVFTIFNQPSEEEIKKQQAEVALQRAKEGQRNKQQKADIETTTLKAHQEEMLTPKLGANGKQLSTEKGLVYLTKAKKDTVIPTALPTNQSKQKGELIRLENEKLIIDFSTKGGKVAAVYLKEFQSYDNYAKSKKKKDVVPLRLFGDGDAVNELVLPLQSGEVKTGSYLFTVKNQTANTISFELDLGEGQKIQHTYSLAKDAYDINYAVSIEGFEGKMNPNNIVFNWETAFRRTERLFSEQRKVSTICFNNKNEGFDYLSEVADDSQEAEDDVEWVAYKQSYFSSILRPEKGITKKGSSFKISNYKEGSPRAWTHIKGFSSKTNLGFDNATKSTVSMNWFFGPNDYETLKSYKHGYDDILNFGWGLFRWINLYAVQPLFNFLTNTGMSVGIAILMLTLILKFVLMPIQWKMFISSAKMRILKPEVDEIAKKYPKKEDAMKKQMETMALYNESGASQLAGCIPMLIQMPILLAVFRFFPSAFELRQRPFLWAEDLSSYDSIWNFGTHIWFYGDHVSLFTLLMAATTLVYTYLNSGNMQQQQQPGMESMKVIMYFFPVMMIFFFNNYSSGLSYYYFISTLASILIMVMIKQFFVDEDKLKLKMAEIKASKANKSKDKKKSKFQERLEQLQKMQQEQKKK